MAEPAPVSKPRAVLPRPGVGPSEPALTLALAAIDQLDGIDANLPLLAESGTALSSWTELGLAARRVTAAYRTAAGYASRKHNRSEDAALVRSRLFRARTAVEGTIEASIEALIESGGIPLAALFKQPFFGYCKKQGVSLRISLRTCVPTQLCGGACYAHDGRERVTNSILKGCINHVIVRRWERDPSVRTLLLPHIDRAIRLARQDADLARVENGFVRRPRIRFAHIGETAAYPAFVNWMAQEVHKRSHGEVDSVLYTRHPGVQEIDTALVVVNLTIDAASSSRRRWVGPEVRVVASSWGGLTILDAATNFLEHHENDQHFAPKGKGQVCPATLPDVENRFCDAFKCALCFVQPQSEREAHLNESETATPKLRARNVSLLRANTRTLQPKGGKK